ncbi:MAG: hypothetical protein KTR31_37295 [Myxococcales bacterium]|nr:hypothetical protein [Myxococcales bacterium]
MSQRRGNYSMLMGTSIFAVLGFSALAVDISLITMAEQQAQATADAASHAALIGFRKTLSDGGTTNAAETKAQDAADFIITRNPVAMGIATRNSMVFGIYEFGDPGCDPVTNTDGDGNACTSPGFTPGYSAEGNANAIEVEVAREAGNAVDLLLAPMFGVDTHNVDARSITAQQQRSIMLIQDFSGSMQDGGCTTGSCAIDDARRANFDFLQYMVQFPQDGDLIGLAGYASVGVHEDGTGTNNPTDPTWARMVPIASDLPYLTTKFSGICHTEQGCPDDLGTFTTTATEGPKKEDIDVFTNPSIAIRQAINQIDLATDPSFFRGMLVFSDGVFNRPNNTAEANTQALNAVDTAWDTYDIHVWTILLGTNVNEAQMQSLVRGVGFYQNGQVSTDLPDLYRNVAESLPTAIVD